jgi:hypothetical protein
VFVAALVHLIRHRRARSTTSTVVWFLAILILPVVGPIAYFISSSLSEAMDGDALDARPATSQDASPFGDDLPSDGTREPDGGRFGR